MEPDTQGEHSGKMGLEGGAYELEHRGLPPRIEAKRKTRDQFFPGDCKEHVALLALDFRRLACRTLRQQMGVVLSISVCYLVMAALGTQYNSKQANGHI